MKIKKRKKRMKETKVEYRENDIDDDMSEYPIRDCPSCEKGIVTIGLIDLIIFPKGILASNDIGNIKFYHFTCDRCSYKILTTKN